LTGPNGFGLCNPTSYKIKIKEMKESKHEDNLISKREPEIMAVREKDHEEQEVQVSLMFNS
jgi:hypothetical protein